MRRIPLEVVAVTPGTIVLTDLAAADAMLGPTRIA
jgi:hypothetical protein